MDTKLYDQWLREVFDHEESKGDWRFEYCPDCVDASEEEIVRLITATLENYPQDVTRFSDWQIAMGLEYIFNNSCSDYAFALRDGPAPLELRLKAIERLKLLYEQCFDKRCASVLSHQSETKNPLNRVCYMLWDVTPLTYCEDSPERDALYHALASVMEFSLSLSNPACIESGLHGLGHLQFYYPQAAAIIEQFLRAHPRLDPKLEAYAQAAKTGCLQ